MVNQLCYTGLFILGLKFCSVDHEHVNPTKVSLKEKWATDTVFKTPESVLYDAESGSIFVSNISAFNPEHPDGDGFISKLDKKGNVLSLQWVKGLNDPKGLAVKNGKLYVADITNLVVVDIATAKIDKTIPVPNSLFLNDVAVDEKGVVYVSDSYTGRVNQIEGNTVSVFMEYIWGPNGLYTENKSIGIVADNGEFYKVDYKTKKVDTLASGFGSSDGLEKDRLNNYLVSNWYGELFYVKKSGETLKLLDTKDLNINAADIGFIEKDNIVLVPTFGNNRVVAYELQYQ